MLISSLLHILYAPLRHTLKPPLPPRLQQSGEEAAGETEPKKIGKNVMEKSPQTYCK